MYLEQARAKQEQKEKEDHELRMKMDEELKLIFDQQVKERTKYATMWRRSGSRRSRRLPSWAQRPSRRSSRSSCSTTRTRRWARSPGLNRMKQEEAKIELEKEREEDRRIVQEAIAKAKEGGRKEISERQRNDARKYREHLKIQMQKDEDESERTFSSRRPRRSSGKDRGGEEGQEDARNS